MGLFGFGKKNAAPTRSPQEDYELGEKYYNGDGVPEDEAATREMFEILLGDDLEGRKRYISENGHLYIDMADAY